MNTKSSMRYMDKMTSLEPEPLQQRPLQVKASMFFASSMKRGRSKMSVIKDEEEPLSFGATDKALSPRFKAISPEKSSTLNALKKRMSKAKSKREAAQLSQSESEEEEEP